MLELKDGRGSTPGNERLILRGVSVPHRVDAARSASRDVEHWGVEIERVGGDSLLVIQDSLLAWLAASERVHDAGELAQLGHFVFLEVCGEEVQAVYSEQVDEDGLFLYCCAVERVEAVKPGASIHRAQPDEMIFCPRLRNVLEPFGNSVAVAASEVENGENVGQSGLRLSGDAQDRCLGIRHGAVLSSGVGRWVNLLFLYHIIETCQLYAEISERRLGYYP